MPPNFSMEDAVNNSLKSFGWFAFDLLESSEDDEAGSLSRVSRHGKDANIDRDFELVASGLHRQYLSDNPVHTTEIFR